MIYIYHHLGMGDHIICNGLVRKIAADRKKVFRVVAKLHNAPSVREMYSDLPNITVAPVIDDADAEEWISREGVEVIRIGQTGPGWIQGGDPFDQQFYRQVGVPFEERWNRFKYGLERPIPGVFERDHVFVHDDDRFRIRFDYSGKKVVAPSCDSGGTIGEYIPSIAMAREVHCIDSCFLLLADSVPTSGKLIFHKYARPSSRFCTPTLKKNWTVLE